MFDLDYADEDEVIEKILQMQKDIQTLVHEHLMHFSREEMQFTVDTFLTYLSYPIYKDIQDKLNGITTGVVVH